MGKRRIGMLAAAVFGVALSGLVSSAFAQTQPTTKADVAPPQVSTPYWGQQPMYQQAPAAPVPGEQLLTQTVMAVPQARADAVVAKWTYRRLDHQLNIASDGMRRDFRQSDEYAKALSDFNAAYADLESARTRATRSLADSDEYQAAASLRKNLSSQIADEHDARKPDRERLVALASLKLDYIEPIRALEIDAFSSDPAVREARTKLLNAAHALAKLEQRFSRDVRDSIELADLRKGREDARIQMLASSAYYDEMQVARAIAIDFAYAGQGYAPTTYHNNNYGYSYGGYYGGGYGYSGGFYGGGSGTTVGVGGGYTGPFGVTGNSPFGRGSNALIGPGPNPNPPRGDNNANPGNVFGTGHIPSPFGTGTPGPFGNGKIGR